MLGYMTKGGVSFSESDEMTPYERQIALDTIREAYEEQNKAHQRAIEAAQIQKNNSAPKSGLHH